MELDADVIVVGGGVNGTGVARDCALRGLKVVLFEKHDFGFGASGNSSGMIHGGPRYLLRHPEVTEQSCLDSGFIQKIAPHLVFRIPFLFPVVGRGLRANIELAALDAFFTYYDRYQPLKGGKSHVLLRRDELRVVEPGLQGEYAGAVSFDEWGMDGARLCVGNALDAHERGASVFNHHEVVELIRDAGDRGVTGVVSRNTLDGSRVRAHGRIVVNATGAWGPLTASLGAPTELRLRPGKGIHVVYDRRFSNYGTLTKAVDGRMIFLMPWENLSWIATTDDDYYGDLDRVTATTDEVRYLVEGIARIFPAVREARIIGTTAGVRPTLYAYGKPEDALSREHRIVDHGTSDGVPGLYSMVGGKLASYRIFSQEMTDIIVSRLGRYDPCRTHLTPLPGGDDAVSTDALAQLYDISETAIRRLAHRHGSRAPQVLDAVKTDNSQRRVVCPCEPVLECEVRYVCRHEFAKTLDDVARRTRLGMGACGAMRCAFRAAELVAKECGYSMQEAPSAALRFLESRYRSRSVGLDGAQVRQEELLAARLLAGGIRS